MIREWAGMAWGLENVIAEVDGDGGELELLQEDVQFRRVMAITGPDATKRRAALLAELYPELTEASCEELVGEMKRRFTEQDATELRALEWVVAHAGQPFTIEDLVTGVFPELTTVEREDLTLTIARSRLQRRRQD